MPIIEPNPREPDPRLYPILKRYSRGEIGAANAAFEIQAMGLPGFDDPSASEVILWSISAGFGIPSPTHEEATAEADQILRRRREGGADRSG